MLWFYSCPSGRRGKIPSVQPHQSILQAKTLLIACPLPCHSHWDVLNQKGFPGDRKVSTKTLSIHRNCAHTVGTLYSLFCFHRTEDSEQGQGTCVPAGSVRRGNDPNMRSRRTLCGKAVLCGDTLTFVEEGALFPLLSLLPGDDSVIHLFHYPHFKLRKIHLRVKVLSRSH